MVNDPTMREIIMEPLYLAPVSLEEINSEPILDETGNPLRDEVGLVIYGG
jgi:hypothetical protein